MSESVAAVVVTYNRARLLLECLSGLLNQSRTLEKIIVIDNASTDGTQGILEARGYLTNDKVDYVRVAENSGGAGGFYTGVKRGFEFGFDWLWLMDDDAEPKTDSLELMIPAFIDSETVAVANLVVGIDSRPQYSHRGWLDLKSTSMQVVRCIAEADLSKNSRLTFASFVGLAIRTSVIPLIGLPKKEFFIHGDDFEYCCRISSIGNIVLNPNSVILHKDHQKAGMETRVVMGRSSVRVPLDKLWLRYYGLRNLIWLRRRECGPRTALRFILKRVIATAMGVLLYDDHKVIRLRFWFHAFVDGWCGIFDNAKPKRLTNIPARVGR